jgi:two-component system sensor histidine kinase UhpB
VEVEKRQNVQVTFTAHGDLGHVHPDVAVCFFRIAQEAIRNGILHGEARRLRVSVGRSGEDLELTVTDDGRGFDLEAVRRTAGGLGLVSMEERARVVSAEVRIVTQAGRGTTIDVRGPAEPPQPVRLAHTGVDGRSESAAGVSATH